MCRGFHCTWWRVLLGHRAVKWQANDTASDTQYKFRFFCFVIFLYLFVIFFFLRLYHCAGYCCNRRRRICAPWPGAVEVTAAYGDLTGIVYNNKCKCFDKIKRDRCQAWCEYELREQTEWILCGGVGVLYTRLTIFTNTELRRYINNDRKYVHWHYIPQSEPRFDKRNNSRSKSFFETMFWHYLKQYFKYSLTTFLSARFFTFLVFLTTALT